jgi:DNA-binding NtrC family response regulator
LLGLTPALGFAAGTLLLSLELAARAHAVFPSMKVLFMTGYADGSIEGDEQRDGRDGKAEVLMKPFSPEALEARVRDAASQNGGETASRGLNTGAETDLPPESRV